ncbi:MAG: DUF1553 domain-containing protein [Verrucomicrobiaceae bacterium]|nr:DUF1553 domain-containing protein [Verrucomicrobiaceae bacterium]
MNRPISFALATLLLTGGLSMAAKKNEPKPVPWSFQALHSHPLPVVKDKAWPRTSIDSFLLAKMETAGVKPSPSATPRELVRRLSFDLLGLPPTSEQVAGFEANPSEAAWSALVNQMLASPHYGERWGRYWLDLARFADSTPNWLDSTSGAYLYRDWVVKAFNDDMPYREFVMRQLAVDQMPGFKVTDLPSLGFLGLSPTYFKELQLPPEIIRTTVADEWEEHVDALGRTFLGLTLACARCHDHKSDPVSARDYYALAGVFASVKLSERPIMADEIAKPVLKAREEVAKLDKEVTALKAKVAKKDKDAIAKTADLTAQIGKLKATPHYNMIMANAVEDAALFVVEADTKKGTKLDYKPAMARNLELMKRGNPNDLGDMVPRGFLGAFGGRTFKTGAGRLELAQALVDDARPLTARVIVNRVWKYHFGRGLVDTPSEFGNLGDAPTHPELLDELTTRFIANNWSIKWLHREILLSSAWRQSSLASSPRDPEGKLYSHMSRRRLDFESWRDSMLSASGTIDLSFGGESKIVSTSGYYRRTLYSKADRQDLDPMLRIHDFPDPGAHSPWRSETITPLQQLFALNGPFMLDMADCLTERLQSVPSPRDRITRAYEWLFQRKPTSKELALGTAFVSDRESDTTAWSQYAQALLASNELLFID